jgi:hypothetical protein
LYQLFTGGVLSAKKLDWERASIYVQEVDQKSTSLYDNSNTLSNMVENLNNLMNIFKIGGHTEVCEGDINSLLDNLEPESLQQLLSLVSAQGDSAKNADEISVQMIQGDTDFGDF